MTNEEGTTRLNKYLALALGISRRAADDLIASGVVVKNGASVPLGARIDPDKDTITVNGKPVENTPAFRYVALNKPIDYVCSRRKQGESETIYALLPPDMQALKAVGRLDRESSGLLLLTNDGDFAFQMTHPKFYKTKVYEVTLDQPLQPLHRQMISDFGVVLPDGKSKFELERMEDKSSGDTHWRITMHEGRNRQIRRTFGALGYQVTALHRTHFGDYALGDIKPGEYTDVTIH